MKKKSVKMDYVIVRSHTAGVHAGYLKSRTGDYIILLESRRLWKWYGASLSQVANLLKGGESNTKGGLSVPNASQVKEQRKNQHS